MMYERLCYELGGLCADIFILIVLRSGGSKIVQRFKKMAVKHKIDSKSVDAVSKNLFDSLSSID